MGSGEGVQRSESRTRAQRSARGSCRRPPLSGAWARRTRGGRAGTSTRHPKTLVQREWGSGEHLLDKPVSIGDGHTDFMDEHGFPAERQGCRGFGTWAWNQRATAQSRAQEPANPQICSDAVPRLGPAPPCHTNTRRTQQPRAWPGWDPESPHQSLLGGARGPDDPTRYRPLPSQPRAGGLAPTLRSVSWLFSSQSSDLIGTETSSGSAGARAEEGRGPASGRSLRGPYK